MKPRSAKQKGSRLERKIAAMVGGQRAPLSGSLGTNDIIVPPKALMALWGLEVKSRKVAPAFIKKALAQAEAALKDGCKPAVVIQEDRGRPIFVAYLEDVVTWAEGFRSDG